MRLAYYTGVSTAAAAACLIKAFHQRPNFYSATVYLSQSNACLLILTNLLLIMACSFMFGLQRLLYGPLRPIEIEQLSEKAWYAVLDTLLAMPSFREDVGGWLLTMFVLLLAGKVWGWIGEGRVDILEQQPPANPRLFHARLSTSLAISVVFDFWMLYYCIETVIADPRPGMVIFTFEFAVLGICSAFTLSRYLLTVADIAINKKQTQQAIEVRKSEIRAERAAARQNETADGAPAPASPPDEEPIEVDENEVDVPGWEEKRRWLFGLEVLTDFIKLIVYIVFFTVSITFNGLPMHIMRDVYMTFASFSKRVTDYVAYRKATSDMNARYPDATTEEIRGDSCIVCREDMVAWEQPEAQAQPQAAGDRPAAVPAVPRRRDEGLRAKKLPCGHILHLRCLKAWLERQQVCPTCRRPVVTANQPPPAPTAERNAPAPAPGQGQQGAQGQEPPRPRPRARMFNLGPLRVGLLNAPQGQMQELLNRFNNPAAPDPNAVNQQGPNHLGLQVPYADQPAATQHRSSSHRRRTSRSRSVPIQIQLMQMENRIMREAHNLGIEQQQLTTLRMMEAEMARLRAQHIPAQEAVGVNTAQAQNGWRAPPIPGQLQSQPMAASVQAGGRFMQPPAETLHGNPLQQLGSGHEHLPEGMVLPEGWAIMPLHRIGGNLPAPEINVQPPIQTTTNTIAGARADVSGPDTNPTAPAMNQTDSTPVSQESEQQTGTNANGPTDERGSPLFVPAQPDVTATDNGGSNTLQETAQNGTAAPAPWSGENSWSFVDEPSKDATTSAQQPEARSTSGEPGQTYNGKGKGRAVEIEDAPDPDAGS